MKQTEQLPRIRGPTVTGDLFDCISSAVGIESWKPLCGWVIELPDRVCRCDQFTGSDAPLGSGFQIKKGVWKAF
ncbi:hypothetical protein Y1Q_0023844 [Alligator mississippiensis]|uniref:Uncharacterized protein n=1 Tax=Alligator mississippiensis TaxID=8496 RepID=A0A151MKN0_ALLMI|nr:hypothetical protein Y1Q_0023844 [Alligator mississippiensis]